MSADAGIPWSASVARIYREAWARFGELDPEDRPSWDEAFDEALATVPPD